MQRFYGIKRIMQMFDISRDTVRNWVQSGKLPTPVKNGQTNLWLKEEIDSKIRELLEQRGEKETDEEKD